MTPTFRFFAGKGGAGKTTLAAAAAVRLAEEARRVLLVSTDPAHSLGDVLGRRLGPSPRRIPVRRGTLRAVEVSGPRALATWLAPRRAALTDLATRSTLLDAGDVEALLDLWPPGGDELVGLLEVARLARAHPCDAVVVDTAPTGHALRLFAMPQLLGQVAGAFDSMRARYRAVFSGLVGAWREEPADRLVADLAGEAEGLAALLRDPTRATVIWVLLPETLDLEETADGIAALRAVGIAVTELVANRVTAPPVGPCALCRCRIRRERARLAALRRRFPELALRVVGAQAAEPRGPAALRRLGAALAGSARRAVSVPGTGAAGRTTRLVAGAGAARSISQLVAPPELRLLLVMGKGGVGKSTCAAALACALAARSRGRRLLLLSADPAHSLGDVLEVPLGDEARPLPGAASLAAREVDAAGAFSAARERYAAAVDDLFGTIGWRAGTDASYDRALVQRLVDLAPPGLDELVGALALVEAVDPEAGEAPVDLVVLDAAPTGHALRLLETPETARAWARALLALLLKYRPLARLGPLGEELVRLSRGLGRLGALLRDPARTGALVVTRPAALPVAETSRLVTRLARLGIPVRAVLANAVTPEGCGRCRAASRAEAGWLGHLARRSRTPLLIAPAVCPPPLGGTALGRFAGRWRAAALPSKTR